MQKPYSLLVLTAQIPYPPHQGASIRSFNLIRELSQRAAIDLLSFVKVHSEIEGAGPLQELCRRFEALPAPDRSLSLRAWEMLSTSRPDMALRYASAGFADLVRRRLDSTDYDAILCVGIDMGPYLEVAARWRSSHTQDRPAPLLIFDDLNAEFLLQRRAFETDLRDFRHPRRWLGAFYSFVQWRRLRRFEANLCRLSDHVVVVSEADAAALASLVPGLRPYLVPNGVDLERYRPLNVDRPPNLELPALVFTGKMDFRPNVDAVCWFADEVLPRIQYVQPEVNFVIVGRDPHPRVSRLADRPGVTVTGFVPDDVPYFQHASLYVVPLRVGGGTRLKVLSAMAVGKAIVSTSLGCEGLGVENEKELVIADTPEDFAGQVLDLLSHEHRCEGLGRRAREFVSERYGWPAIAPRLERLYAR